MNGKLQWVKSEESTIYESIEKEITKEFISEHGCEPSIFWQGMIQSAALSKMYKMGYHKL